MNAKELQARRNRTLDHIDFHSKSGSHVNCIRINVNNSLEHEIAKLKLAYALIKDDEHDIMTEAVFENGGRCDLIDLDDSLIYEIVKSESDSSLKIKSEKYPFEIKEVII